MKKITLFLLLALITLPVFSFSKNNLVTVRGHIVSYGPEPFNYPGIKTDKNKVYGISASDEVKKELLDAQGKHIELQGYFHSPETDKFDSEALQDGYIEVEDWKIIEKGR